ncbi:MAG: nuclear transport factor 2 family protein [Brevundimonas sp.]|uniref:nuclear transport factor 2 family protein n=1 Tax=Brevundimonas sp. TaxID=1871086 RepID=UPI00260814C7|nr:nuclear transport factor 2 family protein [Brevundimonas sp.]MDI6623420.1 nuclear transport factor 2 family protein [Brevundimonas sp.]MDQ7811485.1 nuclear transport factor 2 family protein [Brevundimonas sp.]
MKPLIIAAALAAVLTAAPAFAQDAWRAHSPEVQAVDAAVRAPLEAYLRGHATGRAEDFRPAFHPDAQLWGMRNGTLIRMTAEQYISRASGAPPADEAQRRRWIESIDITGDTAVAKIVLDYPTVRFTDYMALSRIDGRWVIVNKMFQAEPKAAAN